MNGRLGNLLVVCVAVLLCYGMMVSKPHYADLTGPIPVDGDMKDTVAARSFDVHVDRVTFAQTLEAQRFGKQRLLTTSGLWAVVATELSATSASTSIAEAVWEGPTGLRYRISERVAFGPELPPHVVEPGLPRRGLFVFEVPADQIRGATLLVSARRFAALDSQVRIRLDDLPLEADGWPKGVVAVHEIGAPR